MIGSYPVVDIYLPRADATSRPVPGALRDREPPRRSHPTTAAVLLACGADPMGAIRLVLAAEEAAEAELAVQAVGGAVELPDRALEAVRVSMARAGGSALPAGAVVHVERLVIPAGVAADRQGPRQQPVSRLGRRVAGYR